MECRETGLRGGFWCKLFSTALLKKVQLMIPDEILIADDEHAGCTLDDFKVISSDRIEEVSYDYVAIIVKNKGKAQKMKTILMKQKISDKAVIWCEQPEAYWKFVEAENVKDEAYKIRT